MIEATPLPAEKSRRVLKDVGLASLSNRSLILFLIPSSMVVLIGNINRIEPHIIEWSAVNLFAYVVPVSVILALRGLVAKTKEFLPIATLAVLLLAGVARGITVYTFGILLPMVPDWGLWVRLIGALTLVVGGFVSLGLYESSRLRHLDAIQKLQDKQLEVTELRGSLKEQIRQQRQTILNQVYSAIQPVINKLTLELKQAPPKSLVKSLQDSVSNVIRPLSHKIAESDLESNGLATQIQRAKNPRPISSLPKKVLIGEMFLPSLVLASMASFLVTATEIYFPGSPFLAGLVLLFWVYVGTGLSKRLLGNVEARTSVAFVYVTGLMVVIASLSFGSLKLFGLHVDALMFIQYLLALLVIGYLVFALQLARTQRVIVENETEAILRELERLNAKLRQEAWLNRKNIATALHGSVQSVFYSSAIKLSQASQASPELVETIENDMNQALERVFEDGSSEDFETAFADLVELWDSVASISLEADNLSQTLLSTNSIIAKCCLEVIREGVSNAIRHAGAKNIEVKIQQKEVGTLNIQVINDGSPPPPDIESGYGSEILNQLTTRWSLTGGEKTTLCAEIVI